MGSVIDAFFPASVGLDPVKVQDLLNEAFAQLQPELAILQSRSLFSKDPGSWSVVRREACPHQLEHLDAYGPFGFDAKIFQRTALLTSMERFGPIRYPDMGREFTTALRTIFDQVPLALRSGYRLAVASGGGSTDREFNLLCQGASFEDICDLLRENIGPPARSWHELETWVEEDWEVVGRDWLLRE